MSLKNELEVDSVFFSYGKTRVLSDIYFKCHTGSIIGILGKNGSGKSTLLKVIFGSLRASNINIRMNGAPTNKLYKQPDLIAYLPQHEFLVKNQTTAKMAHLFLDKNQVEELFRDEEIAKINNKKVKNLSKGQLRYLEVNLVVRLKKKFILLDELFSKVDPLNVEKIKQLIQAESKTKGIVITDHDYRNVIDICTEIYLLSHGSLHRVDSVNDLITFGYIKNSP